MAKVALSTKISEELKAELEKQAEEKDITLSEHVANLLTQVNENTEKGQQEFEFLVKELEEKNKQIKEFQTMQKNEQEIRLHKEKQRLIEIEKEQKELITVNEPKSKETATEESKGWRFWK